MKQRLSTCKIFKGLVLQRQWLDILEETKKKKAAVDSQRKEAAAAAAAESRNSSTRNSSVRTSTRMSTTSSASFDSLNRKYIGSEMPFVIPNRRKPKLYSSVLSSFILIS